MAKQTIATFSPESARAIVAFIGAELAKQPKGRPVPDTRIWHREVTFALVDVTQDGGDAGDASNPCTFTYSYTDPDGASHTTEAPVWHRQTGRLGAYLAGEHGLLGQDNDGVWFLAEVDEVPDIDDDDGEKGWNPPPRYPNDMAEPDHVPAPGSNKCDAANLLKCRTNITMVVDGWTDADVAFNDTHTLAYVNDGDGPHWEISGLAGGREIHIVCNNSPDIWEIVFKGATTANDPVYGELPSRRSCPPLGEYAPSTVIHFSAPYPVAVTAECIA